LVLLTKADKLTRAEQAKACRSRGCRPAAAR
jgi:GTP-binding protein EngB required for normal cell division